MWLGFRAAKPELLPRWRHRRPGASGIETFQIFAADLAG